MFAKTAVTGSDMHPLYRFLGKEKPGMMVRRRGDGSGRSTIAGPATSRSPASPSQGKESPWWNFGKFLLNREGVVVERYGPSTTPAAIAADIEKLL